MNLENGSVPTTSRAAGKRSPLTWRLLVAADVACVILFAVSGLGFALLDRPEIGFILSCAFLFAALALYLALSELVCLTCGRRFRNTLIQFSWFGNRTYARCPRCRDWQWCRMEVWAEVKHVPTRPDHR
jgi:hypothetical protein